jgi:hypothetical protein
MVIFSSPYIKSVKLNNDDAYITNFMLPRMLFKGSFSKARHVRRDRIDMLFTSGTGRDWHIAAMPTHQTPTLQVGNVPHKSGRVTLLQARGGDY